ncbi:M protein [Mycolicibacter engbaekii]|uniref:M protein n=1 Tax=Mycolicibacter engbaekii TaxID=188915 RepID=A0A1X1T797_9MYCO|nr:M protein [Mycolicibacter engbaekii]ORV40407.1 M protein [Mycolicibacter engbaekii]
MTSDEPDDRYLLEHSPPIRGVELDRVSLQIDSHYAQGTVSDIEAHMPRDGSRIIALTNQLSESQANLESASAQFTELASAIPGDIVDLSDRLSGILNGAMAEAEDIRAEAQRFADELRTAAQSEAAAVLADAEAQRREAAELRAELETQHKHLRAQAAHLRRQAVLSAAEIMKEAESHASAILTEMNQAITSHVADAQRRLAELIDARAKIVDQIERSTSQANRAKQVNAETQVNAARQVDRESALSARETWFRENRPR